MRILIKVAILLIFVLLINQLISGQVIFFASNYRLDMSLIALIVLQVLLLIIVYYTVRIIVNLFYIPQKIKNFKLKRINNKYRQEFNRALINFFAGRYSQVYSFTSQVITRKINRENKHLSLLLAFKAANYLTVTTDRLVEELKKYDEDSSAINMILLEKCYLAGKYDRCVDILNKITDKDNIFAKHLAVKIYLKLKNFDKALEALKYIENEKFSIEKKLEIYTELFHNTQDFAELNHFYRKLSLTEQKNPAIIKMYYEALINLGQYEMAFELIENDIQQNLAVVADKLLIVFIQNLADNSLLLQLFEICETYLETNKNNYIVFLALGIISFKLSLFDKAEIYIINSLQIKKTTKGYVYLGFVADKQDDIKLKKQTEEDLLNYYDQTKH